MTRVAVRVRPSALPCLAFTALAGTLAFAPLGAQQAATDQLSALAYRHIGVVGNRIASVLGPAAMGVVAQAWGLEYAFYFAGVTISLMMAAMAIYLWRNPDVARSGEM